MDVERDHGSLVIQFEKGRSAAAGRSSRRALEYPSFLDEVFDDQRNRAPLQAGDASEIGTRERLAGPYKIKDEVPVNLAWRLVRRALPASKRKPRRLRSDHSFAFRLMKEQCSAADKKQLERLMSRSRSAGVRTEAEPTAV
jgi:hypothetical protein